MRSMGYSRLRRFVSVPFPQLRGRWLTLAAAVIVATVGLVAVRAQSDPTLQISDGMIRGHHTDDGGAAHATSTSST